MYFNVWIYVNAENIEFLIFGYHYFQMIQRFLFDNETKKMDCKVS